MGACRSEIRERGVSAPKSPYATEPCGTYLFAEVPGHDVRVNADLFPEGVFSPDFHIQCRYATAPVEDDLPHYKGTPARFKGSGELMQWW
jgi:hypothetical protein